MVLVCPNRTLARSGSSRIGAERADSNVAEFNLYWIELQSYSARRSQIGERVLHTETSLIVNCSC